MNAAGSFGIGNGMEGKNCGVHPNSNERRGGQASGYGWTMDRGQQRTAALIIRGDNWGGR
jgi:hypothetical protein